MLETLLMVTVLSQNLEKTESAYEQYLGYELVERGKISEPLAKSWGAKNVAGRNYLVMQPESNKQVFLRFIEDKHKTDYKPMRQEGWNAIEILVQNPDLLAEQLKDSPFKLIRPPRFLTKKRNILAFQAQGPNNELLYFTRVIDPAKSSFNLGVADSFVDNVFIMVLGGTNMAGMKGFYREQLKVPVSGPYPYRIGVLSEAYNLPEETIHSLAIAELKEQFLIEIDQYPDNAKTIDINTDELPAGIAMVSFGVKNLNQITVPFISPPTTRKSNAYQGRRSASIRGAAGELIELVEMSAPLFPALPIDSVKN